MVATVPPSQLPRRRVPPDRRSAWCRLYANSRSLKREQNYRLAEIIINVPTGSKVLAASQDVAGPRLITGSPITVADACVGADHRHGFGPQPTEGASNEITEYLRVPTDIHNRAGMNG